MNRGIIILLLALSPLVNCSLLSLLGLDFGSDSDGKKVNNKKSNAKTKKVESCIKPPSCANVSLYRSGDGSCNNLNRPAMGMAGMPYGRLCDGSYSDGKSAMPKAKSGCDLPNSRTLSFTFFPEKAVNDRKHTILTQQIGQFITHDLSATAGVTQTHKQMVKCCSRDKSFFKKQLANKLCAAIIIPKDDPVYFEEGTICLQASRTLNTANRDCPTPYSTETPITDVTSWMDLSQVYGSKSEIIISLREFSGGKLRADTSDDGEIWLPDNPNATCVENNPSDPCFLAGDFRVNQNPHLTALHCIFLREHNRLCEELSKINPHWDDERLYQEARRILIAIYQYIAYYHYLRLIIGYDKAVSNKVIYPDSCDYVNDYEPDTDSSILVEFATAAFRCFHSNVLGKLGFYTEDRKQCGHVFLRDVYNTPRITKERLADLTRGMTTQPMRATDEYWDDDVIKFLFKKNNESLGSDLRSLDIMRGRDHGICSYCHARAVCSLFVPTTFSDLLKCGISQKNVDKLQKMYECVEDIDLTVAGCLEDLEEGSQAGPTYQCLMTIQFLRTRTGDRYFFECGLDPDIALSLEQLKQIRGGALMSRLICDNVKSIESMQPNAFLLIGKGNELVPCDKLPRVDLSHWKETPSDC